MQLVSYLKTLNLCQSQLFVPLALWKKKPEKDNENNPNQAKTAKKPSAKTKKPVKIVVENDEVDVE